MGRKRARERIAILLLLLCSVSVAIALMEAGLRLIGFSYPTIWRFDRITGKALLAGARVWNTEEGRALVQINSDGLRDSEHTTEKAANRYRIAILGDSFTEAIQVPLKNTFWRIVEEKLADCPALAGKRAEAINFGVSGFGTVQELLTLKYRVWKYSPDLVLLAFFTGNDVRNNQRELQRGGSRPYYVYQDANLVLDDSFLEKSGSRIMGSVLGDWWFSALPHSRVLQLLVKGFDYLDQLKDGREPEDKKNARHLYEQGVDNEIYSPPSTPAWEQAWSLTEDLIRLMNADVIAHGATFMLVTLSNGIQVHPDPVARKEFAASLGVDDLLYPDRRIQRLATEESIKFVMLVPPLLSWAEEHGECLHGFENSAPCNGHWNERGHRLAGEIIADNICQSVVEKAGQR